MPNLRKLRPNQAACPAAGTQSLTPWDMDHSRSLPKSNGMKPYKSLQVSGQKRMQYIKFIPQSTNLQRIKNSKWNSSVSFQETQLDSADDPPESTLSGAWVAACVALVSKRVGASCTIWKQILIIFLQQQLFLCPRLLLMSGLTSASLIGFAGSCATWTQVLSSQNAMLAVPATNCYILLLIEGQGLPVVCTNSRELKIVESWKKLEMGSSGRGCFSHLAPQAMCRWRFCWWWQWGLGDLSLGYDWSLRLPRCWRVLMKCWWVFGTWCE